MVERRRSQADERVVELALTEKGRLTLEQQTQMDIGKLAACLATMDAGNDVALVNGIGELLTRAQHLMGLHADVDEPAQ